jgi:hypothetical protein
MQMKTLREKGIRSTRKSIRGYVGGEEAFFQHFKRFSEWWHADKHASGRFLGRWVEGLSITDIQRARDRTIGKTGRIHTPGM